MKTRISQTHWAKLLFLMLLTNVYLAAQNIPNGSTQNAGTVTPYQPTNFTAGIKVNSLRSIAPVIPITTETSINITIPSQFRTITQYSDGLGRTVQTVSHYASPLQRDVVVLNKYDNIGNESYHFLPYTKAEASSNGKFKLTAFLDQKNFYKGSTMNYANDWYFYTKTNFETSPLNRVIKQMHQGAPWLGRDRGNTTTENALPAGSNIRIFTIAHAPGSLPVSSAVYNTGELWVKKTTDEDGSFVEEYTNKENQLILKTLGKTGNSTKLQTYYVYDYMGLLRYVIPPKAVVWLSSNSWTLNSSVASELCYVNEYDHRLRPIVKSKPGGGADFFVYNQKDELVFTQTPLQRVKNQWVFIKRDIQGRIIQSGMYSSTANQATLHGYINNAYSGSDPLIIYLNNSTTYGNASYVSTFTTAKVYVTNYYDDYSFTSRTFNTAHMSKLPVAWNSTLSTETTNLLTGAKIVVLDGASTPTELIAVNYYNDRGLLLQTQEQSFKGGWNYVSNCYDFTGQILGIYKEFSNPEATDNSSIRILETYAYDHNGRLLEIYHSLNDAAPVAITRNAYDEIDRLTTKSFSNAEYPAMKYDYNVRNWITGINKNYCLSGTGSETFGMEISYDFGYTTNYYNGSIAGIKWRNSGKSTELRSYGYTYDTYNRLKSGDFVFKTGAVTSTSAWSNATKDFTASNMLYDENGNLQSMKQMGMNTAGQKIILDDLAYSYNTNSNKLRNVYESASSQSKDPNVYDNLGDFRDRVNSADYYYDASGNITNDLNKDLAFTYDEILNRAKRITRGTQNVDYLYDAMGRKLRKKVSGGSTTTTTDFVGDAVYINNSLSFISHAEGRIRYNASAPTSKYMYDFYIKDHLGSTRSVVTYTDGAITGFATSGPASKEVKYIATSEPDNAAKENQLFDNIDHTRSLKPNDRLPGDNYVSRISSGNSKSIIGPDIILKVMSGDSVKISAEALYIAEKDNPKVLIENVLRNFLTAFTSSPVVLSEGINTLAADKLNGTAVSILNMQQKTDMDGQPKAFLNYILYDEYMNLIPGGSGTIQVKNKEGWQTLETEKMEIPQNGFLRVFSSNLSPTPVNINNTTVALITGKLVEEYNYYPYGLVFDATSAAPAVKKTDYLYTGKELQRNEFGAGNGLELVDYGYRMYDPQIGRWHANDPLAELYASTSPYNYVSCNPISIVDVDGRYQEGDDATIQMGTKASEDSYYIDGAGNLVFERNTDTQQDLNDPGRLEGGGGQKQSGNKPNSEGTTKVVDLAPVTVSADRGTSSAGKIMAGTLATAGIMVADDATVVGVLDDPAIPIVVAVGTVAAGVALLHDALVGTNGRVAKGTEGTHTTYQPVSQSPLNNRPKGFDPKAPDGYPNNWVKAALIGIGAYRVYKTYSDKTITVPIPVNDNTYVAPPIIPIQYNEKY